MRAALVVAMAVVLSSSAALADERGDWIQTDTLGMSFYTHNYSKNTSTTVGDAQNLSEFVGLHYYVARHLRIGLNVQLTERLAPVPASGTSRVQTIALLPQIGWNFARPFFVALVGTIAPWTTGKRLFDAGFQGVFGASVGLSKRVRGTLAVEIPVNLVQATTVGVTGLLGISIGL